MVNEPVTVIVLSRNRPLFLWACLDSLFRYTRYPAKFVLVDNNSTDPMVKSVVAGFERRGMFSAVEWHPENDPKQVLRAVQKYQDVAGDHIVVIESDVMVFDTAPCWLSQMVGLMADHPEVGLLGSYVDTADFVDFDAARTMMPEASDEQIHRLIKGRSPERMLSDVPPSDDLIEPFNPPGRFIMARKSDLSKLVFAKDREIYEHAKRVGVAAKIATKVRHRHLSLLNLFDYPEYDTSARDSFFAENDSGVSIVTDP